MTKLFKGANLTIGSEKEGEKYEARKTVLKDVYNFGINMNYDCVGVMGAQDMVCQRLLTG